MCTPKDLELIQINSFKWIVNCQLNVKTLFLYSSSLEWECWSHLIYISSYLLPKNKQLLHILIIDPRKGYLQNKSRVKRSQEELFRNFQLQLKRMHGFSIESRTEMSWVEIQWPDRNSNFSVTLDCTGLQAVATTTECSQ